MLARLTGIAGGNMLRTIASRLLGRRARTLFLRGNWSQLSGGQMYRLGRLASIAALFLACAFAQRDLSTLAGTVTDTSGGVVVNANVKITDEASGLVYETITNSSGEFVRPALRPTKYTVTVTAPGF